MCTYFGKDKLAYIMGRREYIALLRSRSPFPGDRVLQFVSESSYSVKHLRVVHPLDCVPLTRTLVSHNHYTEVMNYLRACLVALAKF